MSTSASRHTHRSSPRSPRGWSTSIVALAALSPVIALLVVAPTTSSATPPAAHKVTICHRTSSDTNPYTRNSVDIASSGYLQAGHNGDASGKPGHTGPVWNPTLKAQHIAWGDIIPPYTYTPAATKKDPHPTTFRFAGYNWNAEGRAIYDNGCRPTTPPPVVTVTPTAVAADATCTSDGMGTITVSPMTGATWTIDGTPVTTAVTDVPAADHTYVVVATAATGYDFGSGKTTQTFDLVIAAATNCGGEVVSLTPTAVAADATCTSDGMGTITVSPMTGATWTIDGTPVTTAVTDVPAADHTYVVVATAATGYDFGSGKATQTFDLVIAAATDCGIVVPPTEVTPVAPTVRQSSTCEVQGTYTIPSTTGVVYLLDGVTVASGTHQGPASGTITAEAAEGYTLSDTTWSYPLDVTAAASCPDATTTTSLPKTGVPTGALASAAAVALLLGLALLALGSRRPEADRN